jgi:hypothetical protein
MVEAVAGRSVVTPQNRLFLKAMVVEAVAVLVPSPIVKVYVLSVVKPRPV